MDRLISEGFKDVTSLFDEIVGVYALCNNEEVIYVGRSKQVFARVTSHMRRNGRGFFKFNKVFVRFGSGGYALESYMIKKFRPRFNIIDNVMDPEPAPESRLIRRV